MNEKKFKAVIVGIALLLIVCGIGLYAKLFTSANAISKNITSSSEASSGHVAIESTTASANSSSLSSSDASNTSTSSDTKAANSASSGTMSAKEAQIRQGLADSGYTKAEIDEQIANLKKDGTLPSTSSAPTTSKPSTTKPNSSKPSTSKPSKPSSSTKDNGDYNYTGGVDLDKGAHGTPTGGGGAEGDGSIIFN